MTFSIFQTAICLIVCHGGPADHFATFAQQLAAEGQTVEIFAAGAALDKLNARGVEVGNPLSIQDISAENAEETAKKIAVACASSSVVITDIGHPFAIEMHKALAAHAAPVTRYAYYDNPEPFVPGGYSSVAAKVIREAPGFLFANSNLSQSLVFDGERNEIDFTDKVRIGIGYYAVGEADKIAALRANEQEAVRRQLFDKMGVVENGQRVLVYFGGNNEVYFNEAFPKFISILEESAVRSDLSDLIVVLQQHPGAKIKGSEWEHRDADLVTAWGSESPKFIVSDLDLAQALILADGAFYYQTSMSPQIMLAGIPTVQIGHEVFDDILVRNQLIPSVTAVEQFLEVIEYATLGNHMHREVILESLGNCDEWLQNLKGSF